MGSLEAVAGRLCNIGEFSVAIVVEERVGLLIVNFGRDLLDFRVHVAVGDEKVEPAVVVVVEKASAETENASRGHADTDAIADFVEIPLAVIFPEVIGTSLEIRNIQIKPAVIVIVAEGNAHGGHGEAVAGKSHAGHGTLFLERAVVFVVVKVGAQTVIGDEDVRPAVVVVISGADGKILAVRLENTGFFGDVRKRAVAVVVIKSVGATFVRAGRATAGDTAELAVTLGSGSEGDVATYVEIKFAIAVVIEKSGAGMEPGSRFHARDPGFIGDVGESAVAIIAVERVLDLDATVVKITGIHEIDVLPAVAVEVRDTHAGAEFLEIDGDSVIAFEVREFDSGGAGHVGELDGFLSLHCLGAKERRNKRGASERGAADFGPRHECHSLRERFPVDIFSHVFPVEPNFAGCLLRRSKYQGEDRASSSKRSLPAVG